jgi:hypothetical protein
MNARAEWTQLAVAGPSFEVVGLMQPPTRSRVTLEAPAVVEAPVVVEAPAVVALVRQRSLHR